MTSEASARARALVAERMPAARGLGTALAELIDDPEAFVAVLREGFTELADPEYAAEQERVAPGSGKLFGARWPLINAVAGALRRPLAEASPASALWLAQRLAGEEERELRLFSHVGLRRSLPDDPERSWQLMRRLARAAGDWVSVDSLAGLYAEGIMAEPFRWAELEQLVYSRDRWERRLVASTVATIPFRLPRHRRRELRASPGLMLIESLIGDAEAVVQKALSWALRSWHEVDPAGVSDFLRRQADSALATDDGHRAWVVRDALTLPALDRRLVRELRARLSGVRRVDAAPPTSAAWQVASAFAGLDELSERAVALQGERMGRGR
ncbi:MAG: DNA alkylation repair protein [Chloroflexota bacterium]|nr:DNA alkylation repair protein [Chloroflexota bacterium]